VVVTPRVPVYLLSGGKSRRFGSDKARAQLDGQPLISRISHQLSACASRLSVVADREDKYDDLGLRTIGDLHPGLGPLAGLHTALADLDEGEDWLLLCPCDAVIIKAPWIESLLTQRAPKRHAVAFRGDRWQPMPALYARGCRPIVDAQLRGEDLSMQRLLGQLNTTAVSLPEDWPETWQVNSQEDLNQIRADGELT